VRPGAEHSAPCVTCGRPVCGVPCTCGREHRLPVCWCARDVRSSMAVRRRGACVGSDLWQWGDRRDRATARRRAA
jgi:hypothetical protein